MTLSSKEMKKKKIPKILDLVSHYFPLIHMLGAGLLLFSNSQLLLKVISLVIWVYVLPPSLWFIAKKRWGPVPKISRFGKLASEGNLWFLSYQLQSFFNSFSFLERILKLVPGLFSFWLRLWGAKIGEKNNWAPEVQIVDRPFFQAGDKNLFGNRTYISSHALKKKDGIYLVYLFPVTVGNHNVLAFDCILSLGSKVGDGCLIEAGAKIYPLTSIKNGETYERFQELQLPRFQHLREQLTLSRPLGPTLK